MKKSFTAIAVIVVLCLSVACFFAGCNGDYNYFEVPTKTYEAGKEFVEGCGNTNNGYDKESDEVDRLISVVPSQRQLDFMELEYYNFIHFGMNTMTGKEWGSGDEDPAKFNPQKLDTDQWCRILKASGSKGVIITAKHHGGFCLWPTEQTEHSVKNSPYQNGNGDIIKELSESCEEFGLKMGIYLSPWDMHEPSYGTDAYNDFYVAQLEELLSGGYGPDFDGDGKGEIFCVWMDGALGEDVPADFEYDMDRWEETIHSLQPDCIAANMGSEVRWVGNEAGVSRESEWNVVSEGNAANQNWQTSEDQQDALTSVSAEDTDLGSRELLVKYQDLKWYPAEVDVSIRKGWFWHGNQDPKSLEQLLNIYYKAVGGNSSLLLNVPPNKDGLIDEKDEQRLREFGQAIAMSEEFPIRVESVSVGNNDVMRPLDAATTADLLDESTYDGYTFADDEYIVEIKLAREYKLGRIDLREDQRFSQRVEQFEVWVQDAQGKWVIVGDSTVIGNRRILLFEDAPVSDTIRITVKQSRSVPVLRSIALYAR